MSLLRLRAARTLISIKRQSQFRYSKPFQSRNLITVSSSACSKVLFHGVSRNKEETKYNHVLEMPSISRRKFSTEPNEPVFNSIVRFFAESPSALEVEKFVLQFHDVTGLHWWSSIVLLTFGVRMCVTFPLTLYQQYILAKVELIQQEMNEIVKRLKMEANIRVKRIGIGPKQVQSMYQQSVRKEWNKLIVRDNCHPMKGAIVLAFQLPLWLYISSALRNIIAVYPRNDPDVLIAATEMSIGGPFWCSNLLIPDPTFITPILLGVVNLAILETQILMKYASHESMGRKIGTILFRLIVVLMVPIAAQMPAAISLYWLSSASFGFVQNLMLLSPRAKKMFRIPITPSVVDRPYHVLAIKFKEKMTERKDKISGIFRN